MTVQAGNESDARRELRALASNTWLYMHEQDEVRALAFGGDEEAVARGLAEWTELKNQRREMWELSR